MQEGQFKLYSVDCEWHGNTHIDGQLRSIQFAWSNSDGVYIRFRDESNKYAFEGGDYEDVGEVLGELLNEPDVQYAGHHYAADAVWMSHVLGLIVLGKCYMDTEFAQQTVDESSELGFAIIFPPSTTG